MSRISVPISMETVTEKNIGRYLDALKKCGAERVFLTTCVSYQKCIVFMDIFYFL